MTYATEITIVSKIRSYDTHTYPSAYHNQNSYELVRVLLVP